MDLRPHEAGPKFTVATYRDENEADLLAEFMAPLKAKPLIYLGLRNVDIHSDPSYSELPDGRIESTHKTKRLARFAGRVTRQASQRVVDSSEHVFHYEKERLDIADTINKYISDKTMSIPTWEPEPRPEPIPSKLAADEAFKKIKQPWETTLGVSILATGVGIFATAAGRIVEMVGDPVSAQEKVNETLRHIGNDMSYSGVAVAAATGFVAIGIAKGRLRNEQGFNSGWNEASMRLDPEGDIESSLQQQIEQTQEPI
jgi:hypothetical protein